MSVLVSDRKESKFEAITFSVDLHNMLVELMQRSFGVKDLDSFVRLQYAYGKDDKEDFSECRSLLHYSFQRFDGVASLLAGSVGAALSVYPTSMRVYGRGRDYQNDAVADCVRLIKELQHVVEVFRVDINLYGRYVQAIDREIGLIKKWRQRDNKIKSYLPQGDI